MQNNPKVSVLGASYNHEEFIGEAIESILNQTFKDFELIIIDDASSDRSSEIIKSYDDPRIKFIQHEKNKGIPRTFNEAFSLSKGEYIALMPGDDIHHPKKLKKQVIFLDENSKYASVFSRMNIIDEAGMILKESSLHKHLSSINHVSREKLLNELFFKGNNYLAAPTEMIRRSVFDNECFYKISLNQTQDTENHIRVLLNHNIYILEETLVNYRRMSDESNVSTVNNITKKRINLERFNFLDIYLKINDVSFFLKIFENESLKFGNPKIETIPYLLSRMAMDTNDFYMQLWGYNTLINFLNKNGNFELLEKYYNFDNREYLSIIDSLINENNARENSPKKCDEEYNKIENREKIIDKPESSKNSKFRDFFKL